MSRNADARAAAEWINGEVDEDDAAELRRLIRSANSGDGPASAELTDRMRGPLRFGTAGLRGPLRAGPNGMNRAVVVRTTAGVAAWLRDRGDGDGIVVVGCDARYGSDRFRTDTAGVLAAAGFDVRVLPPALPTPVLARAVRALGAVAGVQITASHNPAQDNGYKLYLAGGTQLVAPDDNEIEDAIAAVGPASTVPTAQSWSRYDDALAEYLDRVRRIPRGRPRELRVVATALHGVGGEPLRRALVAAGFAPPIPVVEQAEPDPDFPTAHLPNPEEPGAADALLALAERDSADLAVALDPDADRCALAVPERDGTWRMLHGDETGSLLGEHILSTLDRAQHPDPLVANTIVSSPMLAEIARAHGVRHEQTLTGFKWLVRAGDGAGTGLVYAYEEALGLCVYPDVVRDKDGISAAVLACDLAATLKADGRSLLDLLDALSLEHDVHRSGQISVRTEDTASIADTMAQLRAQPPCTLDGAPSQIRDLAPDAEALVVSATPSDGASARVVLRPSGTEPKLKCYLQVVEPVGDTRARDTRARDTRARGTRHALTQARARADERLEHLRAEVSALVHR